MTDLLNQAPAHWGLSFTRHIHTLPNESTDPSKARLPGGYTVAIVGAGKGIGEFIAKAYVQAGAEGVVLTSRTASDLERVKESLQAIAHEKGRNVQVEILTSDASKNESYIQLRQLIENKFKGRLDALVCNAGGGPMKTGWDKHIHKIDADEFTAVVTLNHLGPFYAAKHLIPLLLRGEGKTLINITSLASHVTLGGLLPFGYNNAKFALERLTQHIGENYVDEGLQAYAIHPGAVATPGTDVLPDHARSMIAEDITLCGAVCVWFSKEPRPWASGRYISAAWDVDELEAMREEILTEEKLKYTMNV